MDKNKVCAVVITYNRKELLIECMKALKTQSRPVDAIYIVDNASTDGTPQLLFKEGYIDQVPPIEISENYEKTLKRNQISIHYVRMNENTGGAGGFYEGVKRAYKKGYDWIWLMDDDSEPEENSLKMLAQHFQKKDVSALWSLSKTHKGNILNFKVYFNLKNSFKVQKYVPEEIFQKKCSEIDIASFVGLLVNKEAIKKVGLPKKEFFLHYDDVEYSIRLKNAGKILLVTDSIVFHEEVNRSKIKKQFFWKEILRIPFKDFWVVYFDIRNFIYIEKQYHKNKFFFYLKKNIYLTISVMMVLLYDDHKMKRVKLLKEAYYDGFKSNFDNKKARDILYQN